MAQVKRDLPAGRGRGRNGHSGTNGRNGHSGRNGQAASPGSGSLQAARGEALLRAKANPDGQAEALRAQWETDARWQGVRRNHTAHDVLRLRAAVQVEHTLARRGAERLWDMMQQQPFVRALGTLTGIQAVQMVRAGVPAIYLSGWQVAADSNSSSETYPDLGLYPADSGPNLVARINKALLRASQVEKVAARGSNGSQAGAGDPGPAGSPAGAVADWLAPIVADAEAGFGGPLNAFELTRHYIEAGAAGVHLEDQLSSARKCGHMGGKVVVPTSQHVKTLQAARLAADVEGVPTVIVARTDSKGAKLLASDADERDHEFIEGTRTNEGYFRVRSGIEPAIARGLAYAPYADLLWFETDKPDIDEARRFAKEIHARFPGKMLAYNLSSSFHWTQKLGAREIEAFQPELGKLGYRFQFITLAGFHTNAASSFELAHAFAREGMPAYVRLQEHEFAMQRTLGYSAVAHQAEVGARYFDEVGRTIAPDDDSVQALSGSTEQEQFTPAQSMATARAKRPRALARGRNGHA